MPSTELVLSKYLLNEVLETESSEIQTKGFGFILHPHVCAHPLPTLHSSASHLPYTHIHGPPFLPTPSSAPKWAMTSHLLRGIPFHAQQPWGASKGAAERTGDSGGQGLGKLVHFASRFSWLGQHTGEE